MRLVFLSPYGWLARLIVVATAMTWLMAPSVWAQTPSPSQDQLNILRNLTPQQQDELLQGVLGRGDGSKRSDSQLESPETVEKRSDRSGELDRRTRSDKTLDGRVLRNPDEDPELRADDYVLIDLTPIELDKDGNLIVHASDNAINGSSPVSAAPRSVGAEMGSRDNRVSTAGAGAVGSSVAGDFGRLQVEQKQKTPEEITHSATVRDRILKGNPYKLNRFGVLEIPGLPSIPLAGLTAGEATKRLSADPDLRDYTVKLTLLRLEPLDDMGVKPFGYDLFEGVPSTFAPVKDIQVPIDYVVGPGDTFNVQLYGNETASYSLTVGRDGQIKFPKLGPISVSGMGFDAARAALEHRVSQQLIGTQISVTMGDLRSIRVFVLGEAEKPGSYTVSGLSTMTNALFVSGGVKTIGSLRNIQLKRNGHLVSVLDLYDLLLHGDTSGDRQLMAGDVIFIPPVGPTATVYGAVRRPAIYELKKEKTAEQLVNIAGGLSPDADAKLAQLERIDTSRLREMRNIDLSAGGRDAEIMNGDKLRVPAIRPTLENSVELSGYVFRPGAFQYRSGLRLSDVLASFDELRPDADRHYIMIRRIVPPDQKIEVISADLERALAARGSVADPELRPRDTIIVFDLTANRARTVTPIIDELRRQASATSTTGVVVIGGDVKAPGAYPLEPSMHVSDLIRAGGSLEVSAYTGEAELNRYEVVNGEERQTALLEVNLEAVRRHEPGADLELKPFDNLVIKKTPLWELPGYVVLNGEVRHPGRYPIHHGETLSAVLLRAGGPTDIGFEEGAIFTRDELKQREKDQLETLSNRLQSDLAALSLEAVSTSAVTNGGGGAGSSASQALAIGQQLIQQLRNTKPVGRLVIDLRRIISGPPAGPSDVILRNGDVLLIPKKMQEVTILGEVQSPTSHLYHAGLTREDYIAKSGGTTQRADRKRIYIVRANGDVVSGGRTGWFRRSMSIDIRPGDTIVVPLNTERVAALPLWTAVTTIIYNLAIALLAIHSVQP